MIKGNSIIKFSLKDRNGFTYGGTTYKAMGGAYMLFEAINYPTIDFPINTNDAVTQPAKMMITSDTYRNKLGPAEFVGFARPSITMDIVIPAKDIGTQANYFSTSAPLYSDTDYAPLNFYVLWNLYAFNHRIYLKDISPDLSASHTDLDLPINILQNRTDWLNNAIFSTDGIPVIIKSFSVKGVLLNYANADEKFYLKINLEFWIDK